MTQCIIVWYSSAVASEPREMLLWPNGAPGALGETDKDKPKLIADLPDNNKANGAAIVICPGGGYGHLAMGHEGHEIGQWLNSIGVAGFIVDYRHRGKGYAHPAPLDDAQRAIRTVRANAKTWQVDPQRVGILGFSAGGHLASTAATHFDEGDKQSHDPIERVSSRPDFAVLCYAVIAFDEPFTHRGSQRNLIGEDAKPELVRQLSNEKQVTANTPPTFLWHTTEDRAVPPENSVQFYLACIRNDVPAELHVFAKGRHGVGLAKGIVGTSNWPKLCEAWLQGRGFTDP
jgi:acetyl esterase/lipase